MLKEKLAKMEERLVDCLSSQIDMGIEKVDTEEAYKVVDIIKDLAEAKYYCTVTEAMEEAQENEGESEEGGRKYYRGRRRDSMGRYMYTPTPETMYTMTPEMYREHDPKYYRDMDRMQGRMYYTTPQTDLTTTKDVAYYTPTVHLPNSRYDTARRNYTDTKEKHPGNSQEDNQANMQSLEQITNVFQEDIQEMIPKMTASEKTMLKQKMNSLLGKIG